MKRKGNRVGEPSPAEKVVADEFVSASDFKARCLALLDQVAITGTPLVVTKHGRPVARVVPIQSKPSRSIFGSVTLLSDRDEDYYSTGAVWNAEQGKL
jgi:prevent-host-death family protein